MTRSNGRIILGVVTALAVAVGAAVYAGRGDSSAEGVEPVYKYAGGLALNGYDPVAYFTQGAPVEGSAEFEHQWNGATWRFATAADRGEFARDPLKYAPQYGGYCAWAVSHGYTAKGDPQAWKIVDGRLYLNYNLDVRKRWEKEAPDLINKGDENWRGFQSSRPEHKGE